MKVLVLAHAHAPRVGDPSGSKQADTLLVRGTGVT